MICSICKDSVKKATVYVEGLNIKCYCKKHKYSMPLKIILRKIFMFLVNK